MSISLAVCKQAHPMVSFPPSPIMTEPFNGWRRKDKVVVVMGATGTGKSRLSIDLATRFPAEIINSDKMQVYEGLDITTNKVTKEERRGVPHHLLGVVDPEEEFTAADFRLQTSLAMESIVKKNRLPIIVGGSNSYIQALIDDDDLEFRSKYECCFLWVDVALPVLHSFVSDRVDRMVEAGLVDEVRRMFNSDGDYTHGIRRAIGVPEMDQYFRMEATTDEDTRQSLLKEAINNIKLNNCTLACRQLQKILRLRGKSGWKNMHRINATEVFLARGSRDANEAWENDVARPSTLLIRQFLLGDEIYTPTTTSIGTPPFMASMANAIRSVVAAATR
ncbi:tRNA dimethylallyltransferase [Thalictrum thalictroides]|uniref:adenylate dimethylallyltransferase (ADP/ATP-dependent) n=1 Tax=Thalictrum thalictroides TaxID=46969 RepID=A0A7J6X4E7_THATH|nr:tRNA dimethylallyltransferase [Thalictrum thalictroides]